MNLLPLIRAIGLKDLAAARNAGSRAVDYPNQVRIYSSGTFSVAMLVTDGLPVRVICENEAYSRSQNPIEAILPKVQQMIAPGMSVVYFGGVEPICKLIDGDSANDKFIQLLDSTPTAIGLQAGYAYAAYPAGSEGKGQQVIGTRAPEALVNFVANCFADRIPVDIYDEFTPVLSIGYETFGLNRPGNNIFVYVCQHSIFYVLFRDGRLVGISDRSLRQGEMTFESATWDSIASDISNYLSSWDSSLGPDKINTISVASMTSWLSDAVASDSESVFGTRFPEAQILVANAATTFIEPLSNRFGEAIASLSAQPHFPACLFAYLPLSESR